MYIGDSPFLVNILTFASNSSKRWIIASLPPKHASWMAVWPSWSWAFTLAPWVSSSRMQPSPAASRRPALLDAVHTASLRAVFPVDETTQLTFAPQAMSVSIISLFSISAAMWRGVMLDSLIALTWAPF